MRKKVFAIAALAAAWAASAPAQPWVQPDPAWYVRKASWQETVRLSRETLARRDAAAAQRLRQHLPDGVHLGTWYAVGPLRVGRGMDGLTQAFPPEREVDLKKPVGQSAWTRWPRPDGFVHRNLRMRGNSVLYLYRTITAARAAAATLHVGSDDGMKLWLNGKLVLSAARTALPPGAHEVKLDLAAGENRLLMKIHNAGGRDGYYFSTQAEPLEGTPEAGDPLAELWKLIERDFAEAQPRRQMAWDREDRVWDDDWREGDFAGLAGRYARATRALIRLDAEAKALAGRASTAGDLAAVRELYYRSRRLEEDVAAARAIDFAPLRRAVADLMATFGAAYPKGGAYLARLAELEALRDAAEDVEKLAGAAAGFAALRAEALLGNPLLDFDRLLLIRRRGHHGLPQNWQGNCVLPAGRFDNEIAVLSPVRPGGKLTTLYRPPAGRFVGDVDLHPDADRMLFSMRSDAGRFQIWQVGADGNDLHQLTRAEPDIDNYDACYLPNGRIIFGSTAVFQGVPCVGGRNQVANLYIMDADGGGVRQLCFDQDHNWCPTVLNDGRVLFTRWEYSDTPHYFTRVLMRMNPDGTGQMALYGSNSYWPNSIFYARPIPGHPSKVVAVISGHHGVPRMGELVVFDPAVGQQEAEGAVQRIPGYGKKVEPIIRDRLVDASWPKFLHPYPLSDKYFLVSCKPDSASPWGVYLADVFDNLLPLCTAADWDMMEPVPFRRQAAPPVIPDKVDLRRRDGLVYLTDVYAGGGLKGIPRGTVKELRLFAFDYGYQGLANHTYIGIEGPWDVHRILGTVPVEADGSAVFHVPANTPIAVQPLDAEGRALQLMRSWFVAMPGEKLSCVGCHERLSDASPVSLTSAMRRPPADIRPWYGPARGFGFKREVQPVLDRFCVGCHNGQPRKDAGRAPDLRGQAKRGSFDQSYTVLQAHVRRPGPESDYHMFPPAEYHADTSPLIQMLRKGHHGVQLDDEAWRRLYAWIDLNVPCHGTWGEFRPIPGNQRQRRCELRKRYALIDIDYEAIPDLPRKALEPIIPPAREPAEPVTVACPGWPFDANEAARRQAGEARTIELDKGQGQPVVLEMVRIPAGEFVMGDASGCADERPPCRVRIDGPFWMSQAVISNKQFALFDPAHDSRYRDRPGKDHSNRGYPMNEPGQPAVRVSWQQAMAFCAWLSARLGPDGPPFTLPTEAQWEYACRAGSAAKSQADAWHLSGMLRDVAEWTRTTHRPYPYSTDDGRDDAAPQGRKVVRGGSFCGLAGRRRPSLRLSYPYWHGVHDVGFRVVCNTDPAAAKRVAARGEKVVIGKLDEAR